MIVAGSSRVDITPEPGMPMAGYIDRVGKAQGARDPLHARALYLSSEGDELLIMSLELIRVDDYLYRDIVNSVSSATGIPRNRIIVAATHTHSGPEVSTGVWATRELTVDEVKKVIEYRRELVRLATSVALRAVEEATSVDTYVSRAFVDGVAVNRINPSMPVDRELLTIVFADDGALRASLNMFACHPTVLGPDNLLYSGDLLGYVSRELERVFGATSIMLNGAAGNVSTRFSRRAQDYSEVARLGDIVISAAISAMSSMTRIEVRGIDVVRKRVSLKPRQLDLSKLEEIESKLRMELEAAVRKGAPHGVIRLLESNLYGVRIAIERQKRVGNLRSIDIELVGVRIGSVIMITFPGELFNEYQQSLKAALEKRGLYGYIIGYANGYIGYVPYKTYVGEVIYENFVSIVDSSSYGDLEAAILDLATELAT